MNAMRRLSFEFPRHVAGTLVATFLLATTACHRGAVPAAVPPTAAAVSSANACTAPTPASAGSLANTPVTDPVVSFDSAWAIIGRTHWDTTYNGVDWRGLRTTLRPKAAAAKTTGELRAVLSELVASLKQSHFSIIPREVSDATSGSATSGRSATGDEPGTTGATLREVDGVVMVTEAPSGSAAARAGVKTGWILEAVHGCPIAPRLARIPKGTDPRRAALTAFSIGTSALAGTVGQAVEATFRDGDGKARTVSITLEKEAGTAAKFGNLPPLMSSLTHERVRVGGKTIGIIRFNIWMLVLAPQFDAAIDDLRDADAIILDVRGNFGGVGGMSMGIAGHFLDSALVIGTMQQRGQSIKFAANPRRSDTKGNAVKPYAGPLALLVDELSISTTEIFAGGLQALGRARVFGTQTSGQALPSVPERLPNGDILYHAIANFVSPTGKAIEGDGVRPDVVTPLTRKALLEGKDPAREAALAWAVQAAKQPTRGTTPQ